MSGFLPALRQHGSHATAPPGVLSPVTLPPFQALLDAHGPDVHRFLTATAGPGAADDCYQETWLAALRSYPRLREDSNLRGWLLTIAHHKAIDHARQTKRAPVAVPEVPEALETAVSPSSPGEDEIWMLVRRLPTKQRTAIALRYIADAAYAEIAAVMEITEEAARRNVHEGLKRLRRESEDGR